jgi:ribonuclease P protein component
MKKELRIKKGDEIELVMKKGFSKANRTFIVYKLPNPAIEKYRVAISAPKKLGKAVVRNKVKRQIRAILQQNESLLQNGHDYFIIARPDILAIDFIATTKQMVHIMRLVHQPAQSRGDNS